MSSNQELQECLAWKKHLQVSEHLHRCATPRSRAPLDGVRRRALPNHPVSRADEAIPCSVFYLIHTTGPQMEPGAHHRRRRGTGPGERPHLDAPPMPHLSPPPAPPTRSLPKLPGSLADPIPGPHTPVEDIGVARTTTREEDEERERQKRTRTRSTSRYRYLT